MLLRILPGWLYKSLPWLYIGAGVCVLVVAGHWAAMLSGALLIIAGFLVYLMRRAAAQAARHRRPGGPGRASHTQPAERGEDTAARAKWDPDLECGHRVIDRQHRELVVRSNELLQALGGHGARADIELLLDELIEKLEEHFRTEEQIAEAAAHADLDEHRLAHKALLAKAGGLLEEFQRGRQIAGDLARFVSEDVLAGHIAHERESFAPA